MDPGKLTSRLNAQYFIGPPLYYSNTQAAKSAHRYNFYEQRSRVQYTFPHQVTKDVSIYQNKIPQKRTRKSQSKQTSSEKIHACVICAKRFSSKGNLERHGRIIHGGVKEFVCRICQKAFAEKHNLIYHLRTHTGELPFACHLCDRKFAVRHNLTYHMRSHTGEKPFSCRECGKKFSHKTSLERHQLRHTGVKPYECDVCKKKYMQKYSLERHIYLHTGEKPFSCDFCDKKFTIKNSLLEHRNQHTGQKPFSCNLCGKAYPRSGSLFAHKKAHTRKISSKNTVPDDTDSSPEQLHSKDIKSKLEIIVNTTTHQVDIYRHTSTNREKISGTPTTPKATASSRFFCELCGKSYSSMNSLLQHRIKHAVVVLHDSKYQNEKGDNVARGVGELQKFTKLSDPENICRDRKGQVSIAVRTKSYNNPQHQEIHVSRASNFYGEENCDNSNSLREIRPFAHGNPTIKLVLPQRSKNANELQLHSFEANEAVYDEGICHEASLTNIDKVEPKYLNETAVTNNLGFPHGRGDKISTDSNGVQAENVGSDNDNNGYDVDNDDDDNEYDVDNDEDNEYDIDDDDGENHDDDCESIKIESEEEFVDTENTNCDNRSTKNANKVDEVEDQLETSSHTDQGPRTPGHEDHIVKNPCDDSPGGFQCVEYSLPESFENERKMAAFYSHIEYLAVNEWFTS